MDRNEAELLYEQHFETISEMIAKASRRFTTLEAEEFDIYAKDKLCEDDYRRVRLFEHRNGASFETFLGTVIAHLLSDYRDHIWGRPRPTKKAEKAGSNAILLERLLREHHSFEAAFEIMTTDYGLAISRAELEALARHVDPRLRPRIEATDLPDVIDPTKSPEEQAMVRQMLERYCELLKKLRELCDKLRAEEALILKFRYEDGRPAGEIEGLLGRKPAGARGKGLFRQIERVTRKLRKSLEKAGFTAAEVKTFLANPGLGDGCDELATGET